MFRITFELTLGFGLDGLAEPKAGKEVQVGVALNGRHYVVGGHFGRGLAFVLKAGLFKALSNDVVTHHFAGLKNMQKYVALC